jgi:ferredoxin
MPHVIIEAIGATRTHAVLEIDAPQGGSLADLCDAKNADVPFSCRSANCGTCRIDVLEGMELLAPPADDELDVLDIFGDDPKKRRLCCQAQMKPDAESAPRVLRIRAVGDL